MRLYNTLTRKKEEFVPITPGEVRMYACGPTVYNFFHIGNARPFIMFDTLRRYMEYRGLKVRFVQNFTDIDDKMIKRANEEGITVAELAGRFISEYFADAKGLGIREATVHPRATEHIGEIIAIIETLMDKGYAYESAGDVYFRARRFEGYGKLSHMPIEELESGARIDVSESKEDPLDFALWKTAKPGEPSWESPWGPGRPGWHIECSAMAGRYLGKTIDIHCGGQDLSFPHHENEIAQSEAANGCPFARYWLHNGYINVDNQKMSKSLNNFFTVRDVAREVGYEPIRLFMLSAHYRSPINYSVDIVEQSRAGLQRLYTCLENLLYLEKSAPKEPAVGEAAALEALSVHREHFTGAMDDDFNTADAVAAVFDLVRDINTAVQQPVSAMYLRGAKGLLLELCGVLGLLQHREEKTLDEEIEELIEQRRAARANRDFKTADAIRDALRERGILLEDTAQGVKWKKIEG